MKTKWSANWKASKQPRKQRKYRYKAPLHVQSKLVSATLTKELRKSHNKRSVPIRKGDTTKILRGQFKGESGKVEEVNRKSQKVFVAGIEITKPDGTKVKRPIHPSNLMITKLTEDKKRFKRTQPKKYEKPVTKEA
jgi:large subunit ribosomal protein L24